MTTADRADALRTQIDRFRRPPLNEVDLKPASAYEAVTRTMVEQVAEDLKEIKGRLNGLLWMVAGTVVVEVVMRLVER